MSIGNASNHTDGRSRNGEGEFEQETRGQPSSTHFPPQQSCPGINIPKQVDSESVVEAEKIKTVEAVLLAPLCPQDRVIRSSAVTI
jgi:hypothetical protein